MQRNPNYLAEYFFDLLVIGGGVNGACAAWDAAQRGLSVALIDKKDFGGATSANSLKIIHGGLRYLQQLDLPRMRKSIRERSVLLKIAPHLIHPVPFLAATYSNFKQRKEILRVALKINDLIGFDRNKLNGVQSCIPSGQVVSKAECLRLFPGFDKTGLTGGAVWYDCQVHNSERLVLAFVHSAAKAGAGVCNYVEAKEFLKKGDRINGVQAIDVLSGNSLAIRARMVLNAAGPWSHEITKKLGATRQFETKKPGLALGVNLLVRRTFSDMGVCFRSKAAKDKDPICGGNRFLFLLPWRGYTIVGTLYKPFYNHPDNSGIQRADLDALLDECNEACPDLNLSLGDVSFYHQGLLPLKPREAAMDYQSLETKHKVIDHARKDKILGLVSIVGVKYTMGRRLAEEAIDLVFKKLGTISPPVSKTSQTPVHGGDFHPYGAGGLLNDKTTSDGLSKDAEDYLANNYGSEAKKVAAYAESCRKWEESLQEDSLLLCCEVLHAVREEMAVTLSDFAFRRTGLATAERPPKNSLEIASRLMGKELGWSLIRQNREVENVMGVFSLLEG